MKHLVLCADDFAVHECASLGIAQLARQGRLNATSVMVLSPRWAQDAALLHDLRDRIDVGLHLDWTSSFALAAGHGVTLNAAMLKATLGGFEMNAARTAIQRQLDAFEAHWQAPPDHVDGHQHVQQFAGLRQALVQVLRERYGPQPPYLRISAPVPTSATASTPHRPGLKSRIISAMGAVQLRRLAAQAGVPCAPGLSGVYDFSGGGERYAGLMKEWLAAAQGEILMCHPAQGVQAGDEIAQARVWEFNYLGSEAFGAELALQQTRLVRGRDLYAAQARNAQ